MSKMLFLKFLVITALTVLILVALASVSSVIGDRERYRDEAVKSIAESYAGAQTLIGPVLVQPYLQELTSTDTVDGKPKTTIEHRQSNEVTFPTKLTFDGKLVPSERHHGLYRAAVYLLESHTVASFDAPAPTLQGTVTFGEPYLAFLLTDVRGIIGLPGVQVNGVPMRMTQGGAIQGTMEQLTEAPRENSDLRSFSAAKVTVPGQDHAWGSNLRVRLPGVTRGIKAHFDFDMKMQIAGTQRLSFGPVGDLNEIRMDSTWRSPLFGGKFLPRAPQVGIAGFRAMWDLSSLAAATQQQILSGDHDVDILNVSLLTPIDPYKLSDRATKYGILFILLTFAGFFIFEIMKQLPIHPVQYLLVGAGLSIFFLLLISFSEHTTFGKAYLIASAACIALLTFYLSFVLQSTTRGLGFGVMLTALYTAVYGLLISEDNALILGSLLLFVVLAAVMFITRKVDWYKGAAELAKVRGETIAPPPPPLVAR